MNVSGMNASVWLASAVQDPIFQLALELCVAGVFVTAAVHKARDIAGFRATVQNYRILPEGLLWLSPVMIVAELIIAATLLLGDSSRAIGAALAIATLAIYSLAIAINLLRGRREIDCGCLGPRHRQSLSEWLLVRNGLLLAASILLLTPVATRPTSWLDSSYALAFTAALALLWSSTNHLLETWPRIAKLRHQHQAR